MERLCRQIAATNQKMRGEIKTRGDFEGMILIFIIDKTQEISSMKISE